MEKNIKFKKKSQSRSMRMIEALLCAYAASGLILLFLAYLLLKGKLDAGTMSSSLTAAYFISAFIGGLFAGKCSGARKFVWGLFAGILYYGILAAVSYIVLHSFNNSTKDVLTVFIICAAGGTIGGMTSAGFKR